MQFQLCDLRFELSIVLELPCTSEILVNASDAQAHTNTRKYTAKFSCLSLSFRLSGARTWCTDTHTRTHAILVLHIPFRPNNKTVSPLTPPGPSSTAAVNDTPQATREMQRCLCGAFKATGTAANSPSCFLHCPNCPVVLVPKHTAPA